MNSKTSAEDTLKTALQNAQSLTLIPLIYLILDNTGLDISSKVGLQSIQKDYGKINIKTPEGEEVSVCIKLVESDYDIMKSFNESGLYKEPIATFEELDGYSVEFKEKTVELVSYLLHCCLLVFNNLKGDIIELGEYQLTMDSNTKLFLLNSGKDLNDIKYLSVSFEKIKIQ